MRGKCAHEINPGERERSGRRQSPACVGKGRRAFLLEVATGLDRHPRFQYLLSADDGAVITVLRDTDSFGLIAAARLEWVKFQAR